MLRINRHEEINQWLFCTGAGKLYAGSFLRLFVFCNKPKNRIKIIEWDGDGFWLYMMRLEKGRFRWPLITDSPVMALGKDELSYLIEGAKLEKKLKGQEVRERLVS